MKVPKGEIKSQRLIHRPRNAIFVYIPRYEWTQEKRSQ